MIIGIPKETFPNERRVALVPAAVPSLTEAGLDVVVEAGAGQSAGFPDGLYQERGARICQDRTTVFADGNVILQVRMAGAAGAAATNTTTSLWPETGRAQGPSSRRSCRRPTSGRR